MEPIKLKNGGLDLSSKRLMRTNVSAADNHGEGIQYLNHKPNFFMRRIRPTIAAQRSSDGKIIYLKKKSAEAYIIKHQKMDPKHKFTTEEIRKGLTKLFNDSV